jgi:hypothetical protein
MCGDNEDWRHVLTCKLLDAELIRADSWNKLRKGMEKWGMSQDMWLTIENGVCHYTMNPKKREHDNMPTEPSPPFGPTFYTPRIRLKVAFRAQSQIGWDNFLKERLSRDCITFNQTGVNSQDKNVLQNGSCQFGSIWTDYGRIATIDIMKTHINKLQYTRWKHWIGDMTKYGRNTTD